MMPPPETPPESRRLVYTLLITLVAGMTLGRLVSTERVNEPSVHKRDGDPVPRPAWPRSRPDPWPTFGSNDRSRWALARALVDQGTWVIGTRDRLVVTASGPAMLAASNPLEAAVLFQAGYQARIGSDKGIIFEDGWQSVDKVLHPARLEFYSTKPPLLTVIAAGEYWILKHLFGWSIVKDRWPVMMTILATINLVPMILYLVLLALMAERFASSDWAKFYLVAAAGFATMMTPFLISFNNHGIATVGATVALYAVLRIHEGGGGKWFLLSGLAAGFTACNELPALSLAAGLGAYLLWYFPARTLTLFLPAALLPAVAMLGLNQAQLGQLRPAYAEFGGPWYEYEGSHWRVPAWMTKRGIDFARRNGEPMPVYAVHLLVGHHGWFSLTPIMLLALPGMAWGVRSLAGTSRLSASGSTATAEPVVHSLLSAFTLLVSVVVFGFYVVKSDNYGGWCNGPRWLMWLTPLWLVCMLPAVDRLSRSRWGRALALVLLAASILSMSHQAWNPWRHPWLYNWMEARGWVAY